MKRKILSNYNNYFQEKKCDNIIKYMAICIQCQGIGFIIGETKYTKCVMCDGNIYVDKSKIASILGRN